MSSNPRVMTGNRRDRTAEAIQAVAEHMRAKAAVNKDSAGFWRYEWPGIGALTWVSEVNA